ncbi:MAG: HAD-IA family hydrolase [Porticoccaceae bacterium]
MSRYRAVLFDLDGTLLDTAPDFAYALNQLLQARAMPPLPDAEVRTLVTDGSAGLIARAFGCTAEDPLFEQIRAEFLAVYRANLSRHTRPFPGIEAVLARLGETGIPWAVVTNKPSTYATPLLRDMNLSPTPGAVICPDHVTHTKPHPEAILLACARLGVAPDASIMIGDHRRDIDAGRSAGTCTVAAVYGYVDASENPADWNAHHRIASAHELHDLLF